MDGRSGAGRSRAVPDLHWNDDPAWAGDGKTIYAKCDYRLVVDNLMDLTHETFVHGSSIGNDAVAEAPFDVNHCERYATVTRWMKDIEPPPFWAGAAGQAGQGGPLADHPLRGPSLVRLLTGLFDSSLFTALKRLPELFCGFARRPGTGPTAYPVACLPQAWSSATVLAILGALLGISFDPQRRAHLVPAADAAGLARQAPCCRICGSARPVSTCCWSGARMTWRCMSPRREGEVEIVLTT